ncbi:MAG: S41 family peptidase [Syntrophales bacterium]|nr:S41 family peptidase [Syntrophales bacterium]
MSIAIGLVFFGPYHDNHVSAALDRSIYNNLKIFNEVMSIIEKNYVEPVSSDTLLKGAINGMVKSLDPHSSYMTAEMYKDLEVETRGSFGGIGTEITIHKDILTIVSPIEDTPAFLAGIKSGDQIIMIDGKSTKDITIMEAVKRLRGPKDTKVTLSIMRDGSPKLKEFVIMRAIIKIVSVKHKMLDSNIGYIRLSSFQEKSMDELRKALGDVMEKGKPLKGLILDLRNNPGGLLTQSVEVSDAFLKSGTIVSTRGRSKMMESKAVAKNDGSEPTCPMIVLVNEGSASAAEIVSGALQDNGRALILGTQTFGKGSVQTVIPLEGGQALKLTTARYYTPNGRSIQAEGITPDIVVKFQRSPDDVDMDADFIREKDLKGHIKSPKELENPSPEQAKERDLKVPRTGKENNGSRKELPLKREFGDMSRDNQLKTAYDMIKSWDIFKKNLRKDS